MKKFNEWRAEVGQHEDPDTLMEKMQQLVYQLESELDAFQGDRFEGFLNLIGGVRQLQHTLAEIEHGVVSNNKNEVNGDGKPHGVRGMKKIGHKEVVSKGVRHGDKDLSSDYKGHIGMNGEVEPFKVMTKKKK